MDPDVKTFAAVAVVIVGMVGSLTLIGLVAYKVVRSNLSKQRAQVPGANDERLEQIQQSIDAVAIEVERIAEAQRFTAKLMADRAEKASLHS
jgi:hypothetical protein